MSTEIHTEIRCHSPAADSIELPVVGSRKIRKSRTSRWRAAVLITIHIVILVHISHWLITGKSISPVEPSETMYTLNQGYLNAGFVFFGLAILSTLVFGRYFCGWGCHLVAYQDLCGWLLRKAGIKPKPFRSRLLVLAPLVLALYMFVWPTAYRVVVGQPAPSLTNHLVTTEFWKTFPGLGIAILTFAVCGFVIVYFLGNKGFCTYACPYGGFFGIADRYATGRIRVTDDCEQCGHCTATCTSNVRVHEEVAKYGMVVDPGCMKCRDCVSVCPNDALYFGFGRPAAFAHTEQSDESKDRGRRFDFTIPEELLMVVVGIGALLAYRGLYNQIPLLLAMGMAAITAFVAMKLIRLLRDVNVRMQNLSLKKGGSLTRWGWTFGGGALLLLVFAGHSGAVQYELWRGRAAFRDLNLGDEIWLPGNEWWESASLDRREQLESTIGYYKRADQWGLAATPMALQDYVWLLLARGDTEAAEHVLHRLEDLIPDKSRTYRGLASLYRKTGRLADAEEAYVNALDANPQFDQARLEYAALLKQAGRVDEAIAQYEAGIKVSDRAERFLVEYAHLCIAVGKPSDARRKLETFLQKNPSSASALATLGVLDLQERNSNEGISKLRQAIAIEPSLTEARYNLALALLDSAPGGQDSSTIDEAIQHLSRVVAERPDFAEAHYNLGVAKFMSGDIDGAISNVQRSLELNPGDVQAKTFLEMVTDRAP